MQQTWIESLEQEAGKVRSRLDKASQSSNDANFEAVRLGVELWNLENSKSPEVRKEASGDHFDIR